MLLSWTELFLRTSPLEGGLEKSAMGRTFPTSHRDGCETHELQFPCSFTQSVAQAKPYLRLGVIYLFIFYC